MKPDEKQKKGWFLKHSKSSAAVVSLGIHAVLILIAVSFVAVSVIQKDEKKFEAKPVNRPKMQLKKLQVPVNVKKKTPKPKLRKRLVVKKVTRKAPEFQMPEITGIKGGMAGAGGMGEGLGGIGFTMPELDFFGAKAKGEKVVFVVHFGMATVYQGNKTNPYTRMTGLTIRNRLEDLVDSLPEYALYNVACYWASDTWAMSPRMLTATPANKEIVKEWMEPVNPLEGKYEHCFSIPNKHRERIKKGAKSYPQKVEKLPSHSTKWAFPYYVPPERVQKYAPDAPNGFMHWGRGVAWAILEQKPDTIFVLTTNYIDGWSIKEEDAKKRNIPASGNQPRKMAKSLATMCRDVYGPDKKNWPTINVVVLAPAGKDASGASKVLGEKFGPIVNTFRADGSVIDDITKYMTKNERDLYLKYKSEYGNKMGN